MNKISFLLLTILHLFFPGQLYSVAAACENNLSGASVELHGHPEKQNLYWETSVKQVKDAAGSPLAFYHYFLTDLRYEENGQTKWSLVLPDRMQAYRAEVSSRKVDFNKNHHLPFLRGGILFTEQAVAISDRSGLLVLDRESGAIILDIAYPSTGKQFWFDEGRYRVIIDGQQTGGETCSGAAFIAQCADYIVHFSGSNLYVISMNTLNLVADIPFSKECATPLDLKFPRVGVTITGGGCRIRLEGIIYLR